MPGYLHSSAPTLRTHHNTDIGTFGGLSASHTCNHRPAAHVKRLLIFEILASAFGNGG